MIDAWKPDVEGYLEEELKTYLAEHPDKQEELSEGWPMVRLGDVCEKITDGSHFSPETVTNGYPYITVKDITGNGIDLKNCKKISKKDYENLVKNGCKPIKNDILFSKDGTVGKVAFVDFSDDFVVLSSLAILTPNSKNIFPKYLYIILQSPKITLNALGMMKGIAIRRVILRDLKTLEIPLPPLEVQQRIVDRIEAERKVIDSLREMVKTYEEKIKKVIDRVWGGVKG